MNDSTIYDEHGGMAYSFYCRAESASLEIARQLTDILDDTNTSKSLLIERWAQRTSLDQNTLKSYLRDIRTHGIRHHVRTYLPCRINQIIELYDLLGLPSDHPIVELTRPMIPDFVYPKKEN